MVKAGDKAPDFTAKDDKGDSVTLSDFLAKGPVVLFFYPAAMTYGCTKESCHFRDLAAEFAEVGAQRIGISGDTVDKQAQFSAKHGFDYPLIADEDHSIAEAYGTHRKLGAARKTFVIDSDGTILDVIASEIRMNTHADQALKLLRERTSTAS
jgi:peroxiredoxin Q/BCP